MMPGWGFATNVNSGFSIPRFFFHTYVDRETGYFGFTGSGQFPVVAGEEYYCSWEEQFGTNGTSHLLVRVHYFDAAGASMDVLGAAGYTTIGNALGNSTVQRLGAAFTPIDGAKTAQIRICTNRTGMSGGIQFTAPNARRRVGGNLIVDGAVTAEKMSVTSLDAISADLGSIELDTAHIKDLAVGTIKVKNGAITDAHSATGVAKTVGASWTALVSLAVSASSDETVIIHLNSVSGGQTSYRMKQQPEPDRH